MIVGIVKAVPLVLRISGNHEKTLVVVRKKLAELIYYRSGDWFIVKYGRQHSYHGNALRLRP
jgi:hypothetical protein